MDILKKLPKLECMWNKFHFTIEYSEYENQYIAYGKKMLAKEPEYISCHSKTLDKLMDEMRIALKFNQEIIDD